MSYTYNLEFRFTIQSEEKLDIHDVMESARPIIIRPGLKNLEIYSASCSRTSNCHHEWPNKLGIGCTEMRCLKCGEPKQG